MRPPEVVVDIDGVLADFEGAFCEKFGTASRHLVGLEKRYPDQKDKITKFVRSPDTYKYLGTLQVGLDIVKWLNQHGAIVHIVSSRPTGTYDLTKNWLLHNHVLYTSLTVKSDKIAKIKALQPALVVDDIISVVEECYQKASIPGILVAHPWNETPFFPRVDNIHEFEVVYTRLMETDANFSLSRSLGTDGLA